jgi:nitrous oxide reductase accessory protein NosL
MKRIGIAVFLMFLVSSHAWAEEAKAIKHSKDDKCPVCGMFVAKYPDFLAQIVFKDGSYAVFDGVKDMMKYYLDLAKYNPSKKVEDIDSIVVTDYYGLKPIDGRKAYYVTGSDVYGPMGHELIPFEKEDDANEFMTDHLGKSLMRLDGVTADLLKSMD